ncbi:APC family permease [Streptomyces sp. SP2-10]|uniref:APC family permease n=1 Tax=Streptomyces sp. SP2-10 TaxID=2873385 RepID=UPI001CA61818|nr:APC family permease [Streptomyces sp. SP2-10]MBY8846082.1 APC family permease [Streptomyces sp. SP2-10]
MINGHLLEESDKRLRRDLSTQQLMFISIGSMVGSGWMFAVLSAGAVAGPAVIISWVIAAVLVISMALNYAETATMLPQTGGITRYPYLTHGRFFGFLMSWSLILGGVTTVSMEALGVVQYSASYAERWFGVSLVSADDAGTRLTGAGIACAIALMLLFFALNVFGIRFLGRFNQWVTWWKLVIPVLTFILLFFTFHGTNFTSQGGFAPNGSGAILNAVAVSGIVFAFQGFREGVNFGGEARNPQRGIFMATVVSVAITAVIYIMLQVAFIGAIDWDSMGVSPGAWSRMTSGHWASQPLFSALDTSGIPLLGAFSAVLLVDAVISPAGAGWLYMGDGARGLYGMAMQGSLPRLFARVSPCSGVPWPGLFACLVLGCLFFLPFPGWYQLIGFTTATASLTYLSGGPQVPILRRTAAGLERPFFLRGAAIISPLGFLSASMVVYWVGFEPLCGVVASFFVAITLYAAIQAPSQNRLTLRTGIPLGAGFLVAWVLLQIFGPLGRDALPFLVFWCLCMVLVVTAVVTMRWTTDAEGREEINASWWLLALVMALFLLSYYGAYGPQSTPAIGFPYDSGIAVIIGLIAYYWARRSGYRTPDLRALQEPATPPEPQKEHSAVV